MVLRVYEPLWERAREREREKERERERERERGGGGMERVKDGESGEQNDGEKE